MKYLFCIMLVCTAVLYSQQPVNYLHSPENIKKFADHLFCEKDYLRFILEYEKLAQLTPQDHLKIGIAFRNIGDFDKALNMFSGFEDKSFIPEYYNTLFIKQDYNNLTGIYNKTPEVKENITVTKLYLSSFFFMDEKLPPVEKYKQAFNDDKDILELYSRKSNPETKSPVTAAILSAIIPGSGKVYTGQTGDGITTFLATGIFAYLSYTNFKNDHNFRGWLFGGISLFFYGGGIYASAVSADIYNAGVRFNFEQDVKIYLTRNNNFMPDYGHCR